MSKQSLLAAGGATSPGFKEKLCSRCKQWKYESEFHKNFQLGRYAKLRFKPSGMSEIFSDFRHEQWQYTQPLGIIL